MARKCVGLVVVVSLVVELAGNAAADVSKIEAGQSRKLQAMKTGELIGRLADNSSEGIGTESSAWGQGFMAIDQEPQFMGGVLGAPKPVVSPIMKELVKRGVTALPELVSHLRDERETKLVVGSGGIITAVWHSNEYDPRDDAKPPKGVSTGGMGPENKMIHHGGYKVRVGDLCYVAIGQIVNRGLAAARYQPSGCMVVNSPVETPALAEAVKDDWTGLTREEHKESLVHDATGGSNPWAAQNAIARLLYYYPNTGEALAVKLLEKPPAGCAEEDFIRALSSYHLPSLDRAILEVARRYMRCPSPIRIAQGDVVRSCAERLTGNTYAKEMVPFFVRWLKDLKQERQSRSDQSYVLGALEPRMKMITEWLRKHETDTRE